METYRTSKQINQIRNSTNHDQHGWVHGLVFTDSFVSLKLGSPVRGVVCKKRSSCLDKLAISQACL